MARKRTEPVALERGRKGRRFRWWVIPLALIALLIVVAFVWLYWGRIESAFEPRPTLPPPAEAQESGVLYQADFESEAVLADWEFFDDGFVRTAVEVGRLVVDVNALDNTGTWSGLNLTFDDFVLEVDATKLEGPNDNGIMVIFRLTDTGNYNRFDISSDGYYALSKVRGGESVLVSDWNQSQAIRIGDATNRIRVWAVGDTFRFEVNGAPLPLCISYDPNVQPLWDPAAAEPTCLGGEVVDSWQNGDLLRGKIGLGAQGFIGFDGENTTPAVAVIGFDNLIIYSPGAPELQP
jgi:hypothetical protein